MVDTPVPPIPAARFSAIFTDPEKGRMFQPMLSEHRSQYDGPDVTYAGNRDYPPASIRFYNPGAVGRRSDGADKLFNSISTSDLPGSDGNPLPTPAFETPADGVAYYGYFIQARVGENPTVNKIIDKYQTGHPERYRQHILSRANVPSDKPLNDSQLASVARAMFEWESGATSADSMNRTALNVMLKDVDIEAEVKRGRNAYKARKSPNNNTSANDSIGAALTSLATPPVPKQRSEPAPIPQQRFTQLLEIDTSPETLAERILMARKKAVPAGQPSRIMY